MRGDSSFVPSRLLAVVPGSGPSLAAGLVVGLALTVGGAFAPARAQSGVYGYQSSYQLYSRAAATRGSAWRPGNAPVYPSGNVYQPPRPSVDVGSGGVYGYAAPRAGARGYAAPSGGSGGFEAAAAAAGAGRTVPRPTGTVARGTATRQAALPTSYAEPEPDYYDDDAPPMPLHRGSKGAKGVDRKFDRHVVRYTSADPAGTVIIDTGARYLYLIQGDGTAVRYGIGVGKEGFQWSGSERISRKAEWPEWRPPSEMIDRRPDLPRVMPGGESNPLGARALYLGKTLYRIHGSNEPDTIGQAVSSGCIRMRNEDVIDLYNQVDVGTLVRVI